jgi:predicted O-methyltransferase YrrM
MLSWRQVPGWTESIWKVYSQAVDLLADGSKVVELGCAYGRSTAMLVALMKASGRTFDITAIDMWAGKYPQYHSLEPLSPEHRKVIVDDAKGDTYQGFLRFMELTGSLPHIRPIMGKFEVEIPKFPDRSLDFVFLDGSKEDAVVSAHLSRIVPKIKTGGVLAGHDYAPEWPGVIAAAKKVLPGHVAMGKCFWWRKV